jgi:hypothetical protein
MPASAGTCPYPAGWPGLARQHGRTLYVDAAHGKDTDNGSADHPWRSVARAIGPGGALAGDTVLLRDGQYGALRIENRDNADFITLAAAPFSHPVVSFVHFANAGKWMIRGLVVRSDLASLPGVNSGFLVNMRFANHDIILADDVVGADPDANWNRQDWLAHVPAGVFVAGSPGVRGCVTLTGLTIRNVTTGIAASRMDNVTIDHNVIDRFARDGIDYSGSHMVISNNRLTNRVDLGDAARFHPDFMQGQPFNAGRPDVESYTDVLIERNVAILELDPATPFAQMHAPDYGVQGIDEFDGKWTNVRILNNLVVTHTYHGIGFYNLHDSVIANNTVLSANFGDPRVVPWIGVFSAKAVYGGTPSSNVIIRNNITGSLRVDLASTDFHVDHNLILAAEHSPNQIVWPVDGQMVSIKAPGAYGAANVISAAPLDQVFRKVDFQTRTFDFHPLRGGPAQGTGTDESAPRDDISGKPRSSPVDLGAFAAP